MYLKKLFFAACSLTVVALAAPSYAQQSLSTVAASVVANERGDAPASVTFGASETYKASEAAIVFKKYLALNAATDEMRLKATDEASGDVSVARYTQFYKGIKVEHGSYIIASRNGLMSYMSGNFYRPATTVNIQPQLTEATALQKALDYTKAEKYIWQIPGSDEQLKVELNDPAATYAPKGELVLIEDYFSGDTPDGQLHLAYHFDIYATKPLSRNDVYVDAATGRILFTNAIIKHILGTGNSVYSGPVTMEVAKIGSTYSLHDSTRGNGINTYSLTDSTSANYKQEVTSATSAFASNVAVDAHWGAQKVYDYWHLVRNRNSYNNQNGVLNSYVDYSINYNNAFWSGSAMFYGNGSGRNSNNGFDPLVSLDICGHEIGHGVCQTTAGLVYNRESGGMNEGFSDIWGSVIENYANPHETDATAKSRWLIGEEIAGLPLRDMSNPPRFGDPDTYGGDHWKFATSSCSPTDLNDQCGVHSNSGVLNKWFYLLTEGGTGTNGVGNDYAVPGIGIDTAAQIAYSTELSLTQTANYAACRLASINYATTQFGACSKIVEAVTRAWYAVNVGDNYTTCDSRISFGTPTNVFTEDAASADCISSHVISVPVVLSGPAPTGGNPVATVTVTGGTAVNGVDYTITTPTLTFPASSNAVQYLSITVFDNGNTLDTNKYIDLALSVAANGSTVAPSNILTTTRVKIANDDLAPVTGANEVRTVSTYDMSSNITSPFQSNSVQGRIQYIITAEELLADGVKPNATLTKVAFVMIQKLSNQPYTDYTIQLAPTQLNVFSTAFIASGFTTVYQGNYSSLTGTNTIAFTNNYVWDGTSNLAMQICFTNTTRATGNDQVQGTSASGNRVAYSYSNATTGTGCALPFNAANVSNGRPVFRFTQEVAPTPVAVAAGAARQWKVNASDRTYFYDQNEKKLIAGIWNGTSDLGCVTAAVSQQGNGFTQNTFAPFSTVKRSAKEFAIAPSQNDQASYTALFYLTTDELDGMDPNNLQILQTTAATDADITPSNTQIISSLIKTTGQNYRAFRGNFTGFGRYFFIDGTPNLAVGNVASSDNGLYVVNNPFNNELRIAYNLQKADNAEIKLLDVTGKLVYSNKQSVSGGKGEMVITTGSLNLAPGNYIVQVIYSGGVFTGKVLKK